MEALNLTREQVEQMPAGRELDILIATRVLGWTMHRNGRTTGEAWAKLEWEHDFVPAQFSGYRDFAKPVPHYSTDIAAAWQVVEAMNAKDAAGECNAYWANYWQSGITQPPTWQLPAAEAAASICRAALLALLPRESLEKTFDRLREYFKGAAWPFLDDDGAALLAQEGGRRE